MNTTGKPIGSFRRWLIKPPGIITFLLSSLAILNPIYLAINPGDVNWGCDITLMFYTLLAAISWIITPLFRFNIIMGFAYPKDLLRKHRWRFLLAPTLIVIAWLIPHESVSLWFFNRAKPDLELYAREIMQNPSQHHPVRSFGLLHVEVAGATQSQVWFFVGKGYDGINCGYLFSPDEQLVHDQLDFATIHPINHPWYIYSTSSRLFPPTRPVTLPTTNPANP